MQCTAHKKTGVQCRRRAIRGATVCYMHGGAARHVRIAAARRLAMLALPAVETLGAVMKQRRQLTPAVTAARDVLDRTLGKPTETVEMRGQTEMHYTVTYLPLVQIVSQNRTVDVLPAAPDYVNLAPRKPDESES